MVDSGDDVEYERADQRSIINVCCIGVEGRSSTLFCYRQKTKVVPAMCEAS